MEEYEQKISTVEAVLLLGYVALTDLISIILIFVGADDFWILDALTFPVTQFYFRIKKVNRAGLDLVMNCGELIPYVGVLPLRTIGVAMVIRADRNPEGFAAQVAERAAAATAKIKVAKGTGAGKTQGVREAAKTEVRAKAA